MSDQKSHPEKLLQAPPPFKWTFDMEVAKQAALGNQALIESYENRVNKFTQAVLLNEMPILKAILDVGHDRAELKTLAKALDRCADFMETLDELHERQAILDYADKNPVWFAAAFADLKSEVDKALPDEDFDISELLK